MATSENLRERLNRYIDDALAMEGASVTGLKEMIEGTTDPQAAALFREHLAETEQQKLWLEQALEARGGEPSRVKDIINRIGAAASGILHANKDEEDKNTRFLIEAYTVESSEQAIYESLHAAASAAGDTELANLARQIQKQEEAAARRIFSHIEGAARVAIGQAQPTAVA